MKWSSKDEKEDEVAMLENEQTASHGEKSTNVWKGKNEQNAHYGRLRAKWSKKTKIMRALKERKWENEQNVQNRKDVATWEKFRGWTRGERWENEHDKQNKQIDKNDLDGKEEYDVHDVETVGWARK